jgi:hypothetical protein
MYPNISLSSFSYGTKIKRILKCKEYVWLLWFVFFLLQLGSIVDQAIGWEPCTIRPLNDVRSTMDDISLNDGFLIDVHSIYNDNYTYKRCAVRSRAVGNERSVTERGRTCIKIARTCVKLLSRVCVRFGTFRSGTHCPLNVSSRDVSSRERNRQGTKNPRRNN